MPPAPSGATNSNEPRRCPGASLKGSFTRESPDRSASVVDALVSCDLWQHLGVPRNIPLPDTLEHLGLYDAKIDFLARVDRKIEEMCPARFLQILPAAHPSRIEFRNTPEERANVHGTHPAADRHQVFTIEGIRGIGRSATCGRC